MAKDDEIKLIIKAATDQAVKNLTKLNKNINNVEKTSTKTKSAVAGLKSSWIAMGIAVTGAVFAMSKAVNAASDLHEETEKFNTVFGNTGPIIDSAREAVDELTTSYAMSAREATHMMGRMQDLLKPLGIAPTEAARLSEQVVKLSADMGSFNNMPTIDIMNDIQSALVGMNRPMMKYGSVLSDATVKQEAYNLGLYKGKGELKASARAQAALSLIMKTQTDAQGDMKRTGDSYANTLKKVKARMEDMSAEIGKALMPEIKKLFNIFLDLSGSGGVLIGTLKTIVQGAGYLVKAFAFTANAIQHATLTLGDYDSRVKANEISTKAHERAVKGWRLVLKTAKEALDEGTGSIQGVEEAQKYLNIAIEKSIVQKEAHMGVISEESTLLNNMTLLIDKQTLAVDKNAAVQMAAMEKLKKGKDVAAKQDVKRKKKTEKELLAEEVKAKLSKTQIDTELLDLKIKNRGLDTASYQTWSSFMMNSLNKNSKKQFYVWKAFAIQQAIINTQSAAIAGFNAMSGIPVVGPALGAAAAAAAIAFGALTVSNIAGTEFKGAEEGAMIRGSASGSILRAGERNKSEAIIPLENDEAMDKLGGLGDNITINFNMDTMIADDDLPDAIIDKIDAGLYRLQQEKQSRL